MQDCAFFYAAPAALPCQIPRSAITARFRGLVMESLQLPHILRGAQLPHCVPPQFLDLLRTASQLIAHSLRGQPVKELTAYGFGLRIVKAGNALLQSRVKLLRVNSFLSFFLIIPRVGFQIAARLLPVLRANRFIETAT